MRIELTDREVATLLAALRNWQTDSLNEDLAEAFSGHFEEHEPLSDEEIDALCQRLNFAGGRQVVRGAAP
jgi:Ser/Thr protein kinase RdoA (MazF antagonist)